MSCYEDLNKIDRYNAERKILGRLAVLLPTFDDLNKIDRENASRRFLRREYHRVGEPVRPRQKPVSEQILETLIKEGSLSLGELNQKFPRYAYCMKRLMIIEVNAGHVREKEENVYEVTERGQQYITYGFGKKFFKLNKSS